jgi:thiosulfate/3-mercaptopyruvate sulfurtransferase
MSRPASGGIAAVGASGATTRSRLVSARADCRIVTNGKALLALEPGFEAAVLDGGFERWLAEGRAVSAEPCRYAPATFTPRPRPALMVDKAAVLQAIDDPGACLVNTLGIADFRGEEPSRYGRPGRIPHSVNLPWPELTDPDAGTFIPLERARARLAAIGAEQAHRVVCYCGGGISATMGLFLLHRLGHERLALYDASMAEWARDGALPIERG